MAYSPQSLKDIAKPIADGFYNSLVNKDLEKNKPSSLEQKTNTYNALYKFVYEYVDNYFQKNAFTTKDNLNKQLKIVVKNLTNILVDKLVNITNVPDSCGGCTYCGECCSPIDDATACLCIAAGGCLTL